MNNSRRSFLQASALTAAALGVGGMLGSRTKAAGLLGRAGSAKGLRILILGGTGFLGPACMEAALAAGHHVTLFNRGARETMRKERGRPSVVPEGVDVLYGNRDPNKTADDWMEGAPAGPDGKKHERDPNSPKGLSQLEGKKWDAVIDTSGYFPRIAKASAEVLNPNIGQYLFISTISVYKSNASPGADENAELTTLSDPTTEEFGAGFENYGGGKAMSEQAIMDVCKGKTTIVRPGFIVGIRDNTRRYSFWPNRISKGGDMVVPGSPTDPIQIIDVRDLAEWCVHLIEQKTMGVFNATGPASELTMKAFCEGTREGLGANTTFTWIPTDFLEKQGIPAGAIFAAYPLYIPPTGETAGFHRVSVAKAVAAGLKFRPCSDTAKSMMDWIKTLPADVQTGILPPAPGTPGSMALTPEREAEIIKAWKENK
ncbi:MAG TPA: NAD-dependent epimerase/dehydratase family protein [Phycisphaerales bacterium]|nr:NAD-dependent epimerase/dehydratase family protein [Phycisphaerales bacterium]